MFSKSLLLIAAACLSAALSSCGSGAIPGSEGGVPDQDPPADELSEAKRRAAALMEAAAATPSLTTINAARVALDAYVKAAEAAARSAGASTQLTDVQSALRAAQSERDANRRRLDQLQASLGERAGPDGGAEPGGSAGSPSLAQRLANLRSRTLTSLERGHNYRRNVGGATFILNGFRCSESAGTCGTGVQYGGNAYLNPAFFYADLATPFTAAPINGVDAFSEYDNRDDPDEEDYSRSWKLLALGQFSAARMDTLRTLDRTGTSLAATDSYGIALGERHGRPGGASGSATWRGQMVGAALDNGGPLAGEAALTYSFGANTVDVQMSNIRAVGDVAPYSGSTSFTWSGLDVNSDGSFHIAGYNNDRSGLTYSTALHPTLGYIDGDFYGPNAEETAGIFTRGNVNGAWLAKSIGPRTSVDDRPAPSDGGQPPPGSEPTAQGGGTGSPSLAQRLANLRSRTVTSLEHGHHYGKSYGGATRINQVFRCSESAGTCLHPSSGNVRLHIGTAFGPSSSSATTFTAAPVNGVDTFSEYREFRSCRVGGECGTGQERGLFALGQFSAARTDTEFNDFSGTSNDSVISNGIALGERHGRPNGASGSATWRGAMVGAALDNGSPLAGESVLTYSFSANTVDVQISNIRAVGDVASYSGSTSFTWSGLNVNSDGSFHIAGYNNDRSGLTYSTALHPTLGYIDGDFYGPNAEEAAGIFTRGDVNGAWLAKK